MDNDTLLLLTAFSAGIIGSVGAWYCPASGKIALALDAVPILAAYLAVVFC